MNVNNNVTHQVHALHKNQDLKKVQVNSEQRNDVLKQTTMLENTNKQKKEIESTVEKLNEFSDPVYTNLQFVLHDELDKYYVKVVDPVTDEVIREIPPEKMLDIYAKMAEYMGLLVDEKV